MSAADRHTVLSTKASLFWTFWGVFGISFMLLFPVNPQLLPDIQRFIRPFITPLLEAIRPLFFDTAPMHYDISSDSKSMYLLVFLLLFVSMLFTLVLHFTPFRLGVTMRYWIRVVFRYYIAYQLLHYGFNKLFKWQFFLPEPNVAYTDIGQVSKDLLYWTAIGSSYWFTVLIGAIEVIAGLFLLFRKTLSIGILLAFVLFTNIVLVNFTFDISVKLFSLFLFLSTISLISIDWQLIWLWWKDTLDQYTFKPSSLTFHSRDFNTYALTKSIVILVLMLDSLWIYGKTGNWNDDHQERPPLHGAYSTMLNNVNDWQSIFVNRKGYFIAEPDSGEKLDFKLHYDFENAHIMGTRLSDTVSFRYKMSDKYLTLQEAQTNRLIVLKKQPYDSLPLFQKSFHWWVD